MNYLAHLQLSLPDAESMVGNLMGDFRKYIGNQTLPENVSQGIANHVRVDRFTDSNRKTSELKKLFSTDRRRFAGIIIDVLFDHFLIQHWQRFSDEKFDSFIDGAHDKIGSKRDLMPERMRYVVDYMINDNWLKSYSSLDGIDRALNGISSRMRFKNKMAGSIEEIERNYHQLETGFLGFFPDLLDHIKAEK